MCGTSGAAIPCMPTCEHHGKAGLGFSLVELVVALVILLVLIPSALPLYDRFFNEAREEALRQRLQQMRRAISIFRLENGRYPNRLYDSFGNNVDFLDSLRSELVQGVHGGPSKYPLKRRTYLVQAPAPVAAGQEIFAANDPEQPVGQVAQAAPAPSGGWAALVSIQIAALEAGGLHAGSAEGPALTVEPLPYPLLEDI